MGMQAHGVLKVGQGLGLAHQGDDSVGVELAPLLISDLVQHLVAARRFPRLRAASACAASVGGKITLVPG
jgi:hypothetical protein